MKKGLIAIMLAFASITVFAQRPDANATPEERAKTQTASLTESLKLTEDQQKQVYSLNLDRAKKMQEMRASQNGDRTQMRESMEKFNTDLAKVLTPEQQEKYKKIMEERRGNRGGGGGGGGGPRR
jgi:periplasmic protein CpxP/Spy